MSMKPQQTTPFSIASLSQLSVNWLQQGIDHLWESTRAGDCCLIVDTGVMSDRSVMFPNQANVIEVYDNTWNGAIDRTRVNFVILYLRDLSQLTPFFHYDTWCIISDVLLFTPHRTGSLSLGEFVKNNSVYGI